MQQWRIEAPQTLDIPGVQRLEVRLVSGRVVVLGAGAPDEVIPPPRQDPASFVETQGSSALANPLDPTPDDDGVASTQRDPAGTAPQSPPPQDAPFPQDAPSPQHAPSPQDAPSRPDVAHVEVSAVDGPLLLTLTDGTLQMVHERLTWSGIFDRLGGGRARAEVCVSVPQRCPLRLGVVTADAVVSGIVADSTRVKSVSGGITLDGVRSGVVARTISGDLETRQLVGDLEFSTVSGELTVVQGSTGRLRAESVSGDVTLDLDVFEGSTLDLLTVSGDLTLRLPKDAGLDVDVTTTSGSLDSWFDGVSTSRKPGQATMSGRIGSGGGRLHARSISGDVTLLARSAS